MELPPVTLHQLLETALWGGVDHQVGTSSQSGVDHGPRTRAEPPDDLVREAIRPRGRPHAELGVAAQHDLLARSVPLDEVRAGSGGGSVSGQDIWGPGGGGGRG